jgi:hypothetical protein
LEKQINKTQRETQRWISKIPGDISLIEECTKRRENTAGASLNSILKRGSGGFTEERMSKIWPGGKEGMKSCKWRLCREMEMA